MLGLDYDTPRESNCMFQGTQTRIAAAIDKEIEISEQRFALEVSMLSLSQEVCKKQSSFWKTDGRRKTSENIAINPKEARIISLESAGVGERVCIDLTRRITEGQGQRLALSQENYA